MESQFHVVVVFYIMIDTRVNSDLPKTKIVAFCVKSYQQQMCVQDHVHTGVIYPDKGYFSLKALLTQRFLTFRCFPCVKIKDTDDVSPVKEGLQLP